MDNNIRLIHEDAMKPDTLYAKRPLEWFHGRTVKMAFSAECGSVEHMWVRITGIEGQNLVGVLDNIPFWVQHVQLGDKVTLTRCQIEMVDLTSDEWWEEVHLLRAQGDYYNRWLGYPKQGGGFENFYDRGFTPRVALERWGTWSPSEDEPLTFLTEIANLK